MTYSHYVCIYVYIPKSAKMTYHSEIFKKVILLKIRE